MHFINSTDLMGEDWRFLEPLTKGSDTSWGFHYGRPRNGLERMIPRPYLGRYRAGLSAALAARRDPDAVLVSHLPRMTAVTNTFAKRLCPKTPHIAFAFNFTDLPQGRDRARLTKGLRSIDEFVVFSKFEIGLYSKHFGFESSRFRYLPWAMDSPKPGDENPVAGQGDYLCSIGGEARDYALLADVMRENPDIPMVIVARPYSVAGIQFSENVTVFTNLPGDQTWRIAADSLGLVIPLKTDTTVCGHVTMVGASHLGIPLVITQSIGVVDYVEADETARLVGAKDKQDMSDAVRFLWTDRPGAADMGARAKARAGRENSLTGWLDYFQSFVGDHPQEGGRT